jgi:hypothetical protein
MTRAFGVTHLVGRTNERTNKQATKRAGKRTDGRAKGGGTNKPKHKTQCVSSGRNERELIELMGNRLPGLASNPSVERGAW